MRTSPSTRWARSRRSRSMSISAAAGRRRTGRGNPVCVTPTGRLILLSWQELLGLLLDALLDEAPGVLVAVDDRAERGLGLVERGVRRDRWHVRVAPDVEDGRPFRGQRLIPG